MTTDTPTTTGIGICVADLGAGRMRPWEGRVEVAHPSEVMAHPTSPQEALMEISKVALAHRRVLQPPHLLPHSLTWRLRPSRLCQVRIEGALG